MAPPSIVHRPGCLRLLLAVALACGVAAADPSPAAPADWRLVSTTFASNESGMPYVGNGYLSQRIPPAGAGYQADVGISYWPIGAKRGVQAIVAGLYAYGRFSTIYPAMAKRAVAAVPTWSSLTFATPSGRYSPRTARAADIDGYRQVEDLRAGLVRTSGTWTAPHGEKTAFVYRVMADRARKHLGVVTLSLTPRWSGRLTLTSLFDGAGALRLAAGNSTVDGSTHRTVLTARTVGTGVTLAEVAELQIGGAVPLAVADAHPHQPISAGERVILAVHAGKTYTITKLVGIATSQDAADPVALASRTIDQAAAVGVDRLLAENRRAWNAIWTSDVEVAGDPRLQTVIRAGLYDLYASVREDAPGVLGPSGLTSDSYAGMAFWDSDTWMMPALLATHPEVARALVDYRVDTLAAARRNARANGYRGAFYPWTAADDGSIREDCYGTTAAANNKILDDPNYSCSQEFHLQADISMAAWEYFKATGDRAWLAGRGYPLLAGIADFWTSAAVPVPGGYAMKHVQPPDEDHHDVDNSAFTNAAAALAIHHAIEAAKIIGRAPHAKWAQIARGIAATIPFDAANQRHPEYDGYRGETIKQADVVLMTYPLDYPMPRRVARNDLDYYAPRTRSNGPAMTDAIHSIASSALNVPGCAAYTFLVRSYLPQLRMPFYQTSETDEGGAVNFLTGTGGLLQQFYYGFSGLRFGVDAVTLDPSLPPQLTDLTLRHLRWRGRSFDLRIERARSTVTLESGPAMQVKTPSGPRTLAEGKSLILATRKPDLIPTDNIARCRTVTATSAFAAYPPVAAVDGSIATSWSPVGGAGALTVELPTLTRIGRVHVMRGDGSRFRYRVDASADGVYWWNLGDVAAAASRPLQAAPDAAPARYVRLRVQGGTGKEAVRVAEFKVTAAGARSRIQDPGRLESGAGLHARHRRPGRGPLRLHGSDEIRDGPNGHLLDPPKQNSRPRPGAEQYGAALTDHEHQIHDRLEIEIRAGV